MMWGYGYDGGSWLGMGLMMIFWLLFLIGFVLLLVWLVRSAQDNRLHGGSGTQAACDIAKQRYARGEITEDEFHAICRNVGG